MFDVVVCLLSSGQKPENPLLLLGQYSDDELEDDSEKALDNAAAESSSPGNKDEVINEFDYLGIIPIHVTLYCFCTL